MSNLNPNTIENVSISEVKELDEFLKSYNKNRELSEDERKQQVLSECLGKVTERSYDKLLEKAKTYTLNAEVPTETEWGQVRAVYREIGNKKISGSKETLERLSKEYSGTLSIEDETYGKLTPKQVVLNLLHTERKVERIKTLRVVVSIIAGLVGFVAMTLLSKLLVSLLDNVSNIILQLIAGVVAICGLVIGSWIANKLMGAVQQSAKRDRDKAEITEANHHDEIVLLQTAIKTAEENIKRIKTQYGVEIFAQTDFSNLVKPAKKEKTVKTIDKKETVLADDSAINNNIEVKKTEEKEQIAEKVDDENKDVERTSDSDEQQKVGGKASDKEKIQAKEKTKTPEKLEKKSPKTQLEDKTKQKVTKKVPNEAKSETK